MNFSSSGLCALIGGPCDFFFSDPPNASAESPNVIPSVAIASCESKQVSKGDYINNVEESNRSLCWSSLKVSGRVLTQWEPIWRPATWYITTILIELRVKNEKVLL
jgi:hypothetical protein